MTPFPITFPAAAQLALHGSGIRGKAPRFIAHILNRIDTPASNHPISVDDFEQSFRCFATSMRDIRFAQISARVIKDVVEQPIGLPDLMVDGRRGTSMLEEMTEEDEPVIARMVHTSKAERVPWSHTIWWVPVVHGEVPAAYAEKLCDHLVDYFNDTGKGWHFAELHTIVYAGHAFPEALEARLRHSCDSLALALNAVRFVTADKLSTDRPERNISYYLSLCGIAGKAQGREAWVKDGLADLSDVANMICKECEDRHTRRTMSYYIEQILNRDVRSFASDQLDEYRQTTVESYGLSGNRLRKLAQDVSQLLSAVDVKDPELTVALFYLMQKLKDDEQAVQTQQAFQSFFDLLPDIELLGSESSRLYKSLADRLWKNKTVFENMLDSQEAALLDRLFRKSLAFSPVPCGLDFSMTYQAESMIGGALASESDSTKNNLLLFVRSLWLLAIEAVAFPATSLSGWDELIQRVGERRAKIGLHSATLEALAGAPIMEDRFVGRVLDALSCFRESLEASPAVANVAALLVERIGETLSKQMEQDDKLSTALENLVATWQSAQSWCDQIRQNMADCLSDPKQFKLFETKLAKEENKMLLSACQDVYAYLRAKWSRHMPKSAWLLERPFEYHATLTEIESLKEAIERNLSQAQAEDSDVMMAQKEARAVVDEYQKALHTAQALAALVDALYAGHAITPPDDSPHLDGPARQLLVTVSALDAEHRTAIRQAMNGTNQLGVAWREHEAALMQAADYTAFEKLTRTAKGLLYDTRNLVRCPLVKRLVDQANKLGAWCDAGIGIPEKELRKALSDLYDDGHEYYARMASWIVRMQDMRLLETVRTNLASLLMRNLNLSASSRKKEGERDSSECLALLEKMAEGIALLENEAECLLGNMETDWIANLPGPAIQNNVQALLSNLQAWTANAADSTAEWNALKGYVPALKEALRSFRSILTSHASGIIGEQDQQVLISIWLDAANAQPVRTVEALSAHSGKFADIRKELSEALAVQHSVSGKRTPLDTVFFEQHAKELCTSLREVEQAYNAWNRLNETLATEWKNDPLEGMARKLAGIKKAREEADAAIAILRKNIQETSKDVLAEAHRLENAIRKLGQPLETSRETLCTGYNEAMKYGATADWPTMLSRLRAVTERWRAFRGQAHDILKTRLSDEAIQLWDKIRAGNDVLSQLSAPDDPVWALLFQLKQESLVTFTIQSAG